MPLLARADSAQDTGLSLGLNSDTVWKKSEPVECGNASCNGGWLRNLRARKERRPIFEEQWGCSSRCVKNLVEDAVRRESRGADVEGGPHRHRVPLGLVLLANGLITHPQLQHALAMQRKAGTGKIGTWLVDEFGLEEHCVTRALSLQWSCPVLSVEGFDARTMALCMPRILVEALRLVPLRIASGKLLYLGFEDRMDASAALAMERMSGLKVESGLVDGTLFAFARQQFFASEFIDTKNEQVNDHIVLADRIAGAIADIQPRASRLVRVRGFYWLRMWLERGAMRTQQGGMPLTTEDMQDRIYSVGR
jgi:Type II secretion system (T2SS), protein E, N-terminal domain